MISESKILAEAVMASSQAQKFLNQTIDRKDYPNIPIAIDLCNRADWKLIQIERNMRERHISRILEDPLDPQNVRIEERRQALLKIIEVLNG